MNFCIKWRKIESTAVQISEVIVAPVDKFPREITGTLHLPWEPCHHDRFRVEVAGDSLLCVNWLNGTWPVKNAAYDEVMGCIHERIGLWHKHLVVEPRMRHCDFARHVFRELNTECDDLSKTGNSMKSSTFVMNSFTCDFVPSYFFGAWDGAYNPGGVHVGIGWCLYGAEDLGPGGLPNWQPLFKAYGRTNGRSAPWAEIMALLSLIISIDRWLRGQTLSDPMPHFYAPETLEDSDTLQTDCSEITSVDYPDVNCNTDPHIISDDEESTDEAEGSSNETSISSDSSSSTCSAGDGGTTSTNE